MEFLVPFEDVDTNLILFCVTSLIAFLSWVVKGAIEKPINDSKVAFERTYQIRIEILTEIKNRLSLILYFKYDDDETKNFKEQIQNLLLKDGKSAYLNKEVLDNTLKISIIKENDNDLIKKTISLIDSDLFAIISKIEDENNFYIRFSNYKPLKRLIGLLILALQNIIAILIIGAIIYFFIYIFLQSSFSIKIIILILSILFMFFSYSYLSKK